MSENVVLPALPRLLDRSQRAALKKFVHHLMSEYDKSYQDIATDLNRLRTTSKGNSFTSDNVRFFVEGRAENSRKGTHYALYDYTQALDIPERDIELRKIVSEVSGELNFGEQFIFSFIREVLKRISVNQSEM